MSEKDFTLQDVENISNELKMPIEEVANIYGVDLKKKESTEEPLNSQQQETPSESTTQPPAKKRGSVVSKEQKPGRPLVSSVGKKDRNIYYYNVNPKVGAVEEEPEVPKGYTTVKKVENSKEIELWKKQKAKEQAPIGGFTQQLKEQKKRQKEYLQELSTKPMDRPKLKAVIEAENRMRNISFDETGKVKVKPVELPKINFNDPMVFSDFDNLQEVDNQLTGIKGIGIKKVKVGEMEFNANINTVKQFREQEKQWYNSAVSKVGDISLTKEDLVKVEEEYNSDLKRTSLLDQTEDYFRQVANIASFKTTGESIVSPSGDNFSDIRSQLMSENPSFKNLKPEEREKAVRDRYFEIKQDEVLLNKYYDAAENLTPQERFAITKYSRNLLKATEKQNKLEYDKAAALTVSIDSLVSKREELISKAKASKNKDEFALIESEFKVNEDLISGYYNELNKVRQNFYKSSEKINNLKIAVNGYSAETNEFWDIAKRVKAWGYGAFANMLQIGKDFSVSVGLPVLGEEKALQDADKSIEKLSEKQTEVMSGLRDVEKVSDFVSKTTGIFGDSLGMVAALTYGGGAGAVWMSLDVAGAKMKELQDQNRAFQSELHKAEDNGNDSFFFDGKTYNVKENKNKQLFTERQRWTNAAAWGLAMQLPLLKQLKTINPVAKNVAPELLSKSFSETLAQNAKKFVVDTAELDLILRGTNVINGLSDKYILGKDFDFAKNWGGIDQTLHAIILHSQNVGAAHIKGAEVTPFLSDKESKKIYENSKRAVEIGRKLEDANLSKEAKDMLLKEGEILDKESSKIIDNAVDRIAEMSSEDRSIVLDLVSKSNKIKTEAEKVKESDLSREDKEIQLKRLRLEYKRAFEKINEINTSNRKSSEGFFGLSGKEQQDRIRRVKTELESKLGEKISDRDAKYRAILEYNKETLKSDVYYYTKEQGAPESIPEGYTSTKEVKTKEDVLKYVYQEIGNRKTVQELEAIEFDKRTDAEHADFIRRKAAEVLHQRGFLSGEIKAFLSIMDARAEASGLGNAWFRQIENITKGEFLNTDSAKYQLSVKHGTPHEFPKEVLVEKPDGTREYLVGTKDSMPEVPNNFKVIERYPNGRFRLDKMGTGEGAQAFGWGLYFTDLESIARNYADKLSDLKVGDINFSTILEDSVNYNSGKEDIIKTYNILKQKAFDNGTPIKDFKTMKSFIEGDYLYEWANGVFGKNKLNREIGSVDGFYSFTNDILDIAKQNKAKLKSSKNIYDVTLQKGKTPDQYTWLEWDRKPNKGQIGKLFSNLNQEQIDKGFYYGIKPDATNADIYKGLSKALGGDKQASLFLIENGIDGIKYPAESLSRGATSETARGFNYVVFDENAVTVENKIKFQKTKTPQPLGAAETMESGRVVLHFFENANVSTAFHELGHVLENELTPEDRVIVTNWSGQESWNLETSEKFARGVERYFYDGIAPTERLKQIFEKAKKYMEKVYISIKGTELELDIPKEAREVLDRMFTKQEAPKTEKGVSLQDRVNQINDRVLESRKYDIIAGLIRDGVIKQKPC